MMGGLAAAAGAPGKVLFVGNSFTYYNNSLHNHYRELVVSAHPDQEHEGLVRSLTISGGYLPEHAGLPAMVASAQWDIVVLQGYSMGPISEDTAAPFRQAAREFAAIIRAHDAQPVLFMTWAYSGEPEMTILLDAAYSSIGNELDAKVVPVGLAFERAIQKRPRLKLRVADRKHPTPAGTYLAACTFFAALHGRSPEGLGYTAGLRKRDAVFLQRMAWESVQAYEMRLQGQP